MYEEIFVEVRKFYNRLHNILEFYEILIPFLFVFSKTQLDILYKKLYLLGASRVAQLLKT